ncbi:hypothetical protein NL676_031139 [Syzygium grande]|nr:hypothetical protein NL676_031139 [Syzygium grande]
MHMTGRHSWRVIRERTERNGKVEAARQCGQKDRQVRRHSLEQERTQIGKGEGVGLLKRALPSRIAREPSSRFMRAALARASPCPDQRGPRSLKPRRHPDQRGKRSLERAVAQFNKGGACSSEPSPRSAMAALAQKWRRFPSHSCKSSIRTHLERGAWLVKEQSSL